MKIIKSTLLLAITGAATFFVGVAQAEGDYDTVNLKAVISTAYGDTAQLAKRNDGADKKASRNKKGDSATSFMSKADQDLFNKVKNQKDDSTAGLTEHTAQMKKFLGAKFKIKDFSLFRPGDQDHGSGKAVDYMTYNDKKTGDQLANYAVKNFDELGISYIIWQQKFYMKEDNKYGKGGQWNLMEDRGSPTQNHMDHVHISFKR